MDIYNLISFSGIFILRGISSLAPDKTRTIAEVALRALLAATLACLLTACVAGAFFTNGSILLGS
ncbi:MAG: nucleoside transporter C-terminal domain-containing protein [Candidatus Omnitrophota bacterium]